MRIFPFFWTSSRKGHVSFCPTLYRAARFEGKRLDILICSHVLRNVTTGSPPYQAADCFPRPSPAFFSNVRLFADYRPWRRFSSQTNPESSNCPQLPSVFVIFGYSSNLLNKITVPCVNVFLPYELPQRMGFYEVRNLRRRGGEGTGSGPLGFLAGNGPPGEPLASGRLPMGGRPSFTGMI